MIKSSSPNYPDYMNDKGTIMIPRNMLEATFLVSQWPIYPTFTKLLTPGGTFIFTSQNICFSPTAFREALGTLRIKLSSNQQLSLCSWSQSMLWRILIDLITNTAFHKGNTLTISQHTYLIIKSAATQWSLTSPSQPTVKDTLDMNTICQTKKE